MNGFLWIIGILTGVLLLRNSRVEMRYRQKTHRKVFGSGLKLSIPGQNDQYHRLSSGYYVIGRQRRRCDLTLKNLNPGGKDGRKGVSRVHCVLWYQQGEWFIRPLYHRNKKTGDYYSEVILNGSPVPQEGARLEYHDDIRIGACKLMLLDEKEVPV